MRLSLLVGWLDRVTSGVGLAVEDLFLCGNVVVVVVVYLRVVWEFDKRVRELKSRKREYE